jgi:excisionase family DNA binding protein
MSQDAELCSTREAAKELGVSLRTVQLWVESGVLRAWKTAGGHRRILNSSVEAVLAERQRAIAEGFSKPAGPATEPEPFRLLVVDDEPDLLKLYRLYVEHWDIPLELITARDGFEALLRIGEKRPDFLITDLNMPGMDGFRMIRSLRSNDEYASMQIIAVTALSRSDITDRGGLPDGVQTFPKPIPFPELEKLVRTHFNRRHASATPQGAV